MSYTALDKMREQNKQKSEYRDPVGPFIPAFQEKYKAPSMEYHALMFIREDCEELRFKKDARHQDLEDREGRSTERNQIPLHMEYDLDRLCLENALKRFFDSGAQEDAFDVYYCYIEMFFAKKGRGRKMVELLSEYEANTSVLLSQHRDHYAHSVYVFAIGLALFRESKLIRTAYCDRYCKGSDPHMAAHHFLRYWGFTALFHDIGYPFEVAYEQIRSYFSAEPDDETETERKPEKPQKNPPFVLYWNVEKYISEGFENIWRNLATKEQQQQFAGWDSVSPALLLADSIAAKLWDSCRDNPDYQQFLENKRKRAEITDSLETYRKYIYQLIYTKPRRPDRHCHYMDHAFFSAMILLRNLGDLAQKSEINPRYTDALTAILLHNSLFSHEIMKDAKKKAALRPDIHPLAYLLILCDELQCWNRRSYGQSSRRQYHPFACRLEIRGNQIGATYIYDQNYKRDDSGTYKKMTTVVDGKIIFLAKIERLVELNGGGGTSLALSLKTEKDEWRPDGRQYISSSSYQHLYILAVALNAQYLYRKKGKKVSKAVALKEVNTNREFNNLSLEYRLSNIAQAKQFSYYLHKLSCFYTDRDVACLRKTGFDDWELDRIGELEHNRWLEERKSMGWVYGSWYLNSRFVESMREKEKTDIIPSEEETAQREKQRRELVRVHKDMIPYWGLSEETTRKDKQPLNDMMEFLEENDGIRIYYLNQDLPPRNS